MFSHLQFARGLTDSGVVLAEGEEVDGEDHDDELQGGHEIRAELRDIADSKGWLDTDDIEDFS